MGKQGYDGEQKPRLMHLISMNDLESSENGSGFEPLTRTKLALRGLLGAGLILLAQTASSPAASIVGALSNFDINNDTGQPCDEFELVISNTVPSQLYGTWNYNPHYGQPVVSDLGGSTRVHYTGHLSDVTPPSGVEHFGASLGAFPTNGVTYQWMRAGTNVGAARQFPAPVVTIVTVPPTPTNPEGRNRHREIRNTDPTNTFWVQRSSMRTNRNVTLDELMTTNVLITATTNLDDKPKRLRPGDRLSDDDVAGADDTESDVLSLQIFRDDGGKPGTLIGNFMSSARTIRRARGESIRQERDGRQTINFTVEPTTNYTVQATDDMIRWEDIGSLSTNRPDAQFTDDHSTNHPTRYYRLRQP
jgi:hypothetical protein